VRNKKILVTGATRGIGHALARVLALKGYDLVLLASCKGSSQELSEVGFVVEHGCEVHSLDITDSSAISSFVESWDQELWGLVNNAGTCKVLGIDERVVEDPFDEVLKTNLYGPYLLTKGLLPYISEPGRIVNIASQLGKEGRAGYSAYCASKFGLIGMTKCWAKELGARDITVNAVSPGWVDTEMSRIDMARMAEENNKSTEDYYREICNPLELKRFNTPQEVANLVSFLLSEKSSGITGRDWLMQTVWNQE